MPRDWIGASTRAYDRLLKLYPPRFRAEYGDEMARVFRETCRDGYERDGDRGVAAVWLATAPDVAVSVIDQHAEEDFAMARSQLARVLSVGGFIAGALWIAFAVLANMRPEGTASGAYRNVDDIIGMFIGGFAFLAAAFAAVYLRQAAGWPAAVKVTFLLVIGGVLWMLVMFPIAEGYWYVFISGYVTMFGGLALSGLMLVVQRTTQAYGALFLAIAACCMVFNIEDSRVLFGAASGMLIIALSALVFQGVPNRQGEPPLSA